MLRLNLLQFDAIFEYSARGAVMFVARTIKWNVISDWWFLEWIIWLFLGLLKIKCSNAEAISPKHPKHIIQQLLKTSHTVSQHDDWTCRCGLCELCLIVWMSLLSAFLWFSMYSSCYLFCCLLFMFYFSTVGGEHPQFGCTWTMTINVYSILFRHLILSDN